MGSVTACAANCGSPKLGSGIVSMGARPQKRRPLETSTAGEDVCYQDVVWHW